MAAKRLMALLSLAAACFGGAKAAQESTPRDCVSSNLLKLQNIDVYPSSHQIYSPQTIYANDRTTVQVADNFRVVYYNTYKVLTAKFDSTVNETYLLYQCGTQPPSLEEAGLPAGTKVFSVPLNSVAVPDTSFLYFAKMLGVEDRISYVTSYAVEPCMQYLASTQCNRSTDDVATGTIDAQFTGFEMEPQNPTSVIFKATADPGPLNRAEYIKYVATFFNKELSANKLFKAVSESYDSTRRIVSDYVGNKGSASLPLVAWLYYSPPYAPLKLREHIALKFAEYRRAYTQDAGGRMLDLDQMAALADNASVVLTENDMRFYDLAVADGSMAVLRRILKDVDVVIDETYYSGDVTLERFLARYAFNQTNDLSDFKFLRDQRVLRLDAKSTPLGTTAWYEEAVARPDLVLYELVKILHPEASVTNADASRPIIRTLKPASVSDLNFGVVRLKAEDCPVARCSGTPQPICPAVYMDCNGKLMTSTPEQPCAPDCSNVGGAPGSGGNSNGAGRTAVSSLLVVIAVAVAAVMCPLLSSL